MEVCQSELLESELTYVKQKVPTIEGVTLEACLPAFVRVHIYVSDQRQLTALLQFTSKYPQDPLVTELKSKTLTEKLLDGIIKLCDAEAKKYVGQKQVILIINFIKNFLIENPLCIVNDEVAKLKKELLSNDDECKLKQKSSQIVFKVKQEQYLMSFKVSVPVEYPLKQVQIEVLDNNFPEMLKTIFLGQAVEIARKCVQPPLKKNPKDPPFEPKASLYPMCRHLIEDCIKRYGKENCPLCNERALPPNPGATVEKKNRIERIYCGHLFHLGCLKTYLKTPPFAAGKFCPACGKQIFHEKWKVSPELQEARWAHKQARQRELAEVVDFLE
ncbi:hypothetical protein FSP39_009473 [Pinctada imbricata]|uniref:RING-type domain-containing protein n=1 Tax=Pinctada imbricata TaxID=66713 RepID=A0AA88Y3L0_PINIB|nr:hypothetical protein FSP39_009473 [Pinctada imbricata]